MHRNTTENGSSHTENKDSIEIIFIRQSHEDDQLLASCIMAFSIEELSETEQLDFETTAESQYQIAKFISENKNIPVIQENAPSLPLTREEEIKYNKIETKTLTCMFNDTFPIGLPDSFSQLSFEQKKLLIYCGGYGYAVYKGIIEKTYSDDLTYENRREEFAKYGSLKYEALIHQIREYLTLVRAEEVAKETKSAKVIIIYGGLHYFKDVINCFPNMSLKIYSTLKKHNDIDNNSSYLALIKNRPAVNYKVLKQGFDNPLLLTYESEAVPSTIGIAKVQVSNFLSRFSFLCECCLKRKKEYDKKYEESPKAKYKSV